MFLIETIIELKDKLKALKKTGVIGFVPTMGALHAGHISLVEKAVSETQIVIVSIFVNPTQFNDKSDLEKYPRNLEADLKLLEKTGCQIIFAPKSEEIYPETDTRKFDFGDLETVMEGKHRPGHFNGVAQVVSKLFDMVQPDKAYFGLKDFQQLAIIKEMVAQLNLPVEIVPCPIVREEGGLAMSSRNELLTTEERKNAAVISETLFNANELKKHKSVNELENWIAATINKNPYLNVEYVEIVDDRRLQPVKSWDENCRKVCCVAVFCGKVRLIDNFVFN
jgi:pantoate--beta-alanine ligase